MLVEEIVDWRKVARKEVSSKDVARRGEVRMARPREATVARTAATRPWLRLQDVDGVCHVLTYSSRAADHTINIP